MSDQYGFSRERQFVELQPGQVVVTISPLRIVLWGLAGIGVFTLIIAILG